MASPRAGVIFWLRNWLFHPPHLGFRKGMTGAGRVLRLLQGTPLPLHCLLSVLETCTGIKMQELLILKTNTNIRSVSKLQNTDYIFFAYLSLTHHASVHNQIREGNGVILVPLSNVQNTPTGLCTCTPSTLIVLQEKINTLISITSAFFPLKYLFQTLFSLHKHS